MGVSPGLPLVTNVARSRRYRLFQSGFSFIVLATGATRDQAGTTDIATAAIGDLGAALYATPPGVDRHARMIGEVLANPGKVDGHVDPQLSEIAATAEARAEQDAGLPYTPAARITRSAWISLPDEPDARRTDAVEKDMCHWRLRAQRDPCGSRRARRERVEGGDANPIAGAERHPADPDGIGRVVVGDRREAQRGQGSTVAGEVGTPWDRQLPNLRRPRALDGFPAPRTLDRAPALNAVSLDGRGSLHDLMAACTLDERDFQPFPRPAQAGERDLGRRLASRTQ